MNVYKNSFIVKAGLSKKHRFAQVLFITSVIPVLFIEYMDEFTDVFLALAMIYLFTAGFAGIYLLRNLKCPFCKESVPTEFYPAFGNKKFRDPAVVTFCPICGINPTTREYRSKENMASLDEAHPLKEEKIVDYSETSKSLEDEFEKVGLKAPPFLGKAILISIGSLAYFNILGHAKVLIDLNPEVSEFTIRAILPVSIGLAYAVTKGLLIGPILKSKKMDLKGSGFRIIVLLATILTMLAIIFGIFYLFGVTPI